MKLDSFEWVLILFIGGSSLGIIKYLFGIVVDNYKTLLKEIKESVSSLTECLQKNETTFEEFRATNEARERNLEQEIKEMSATVKHMDGNVKTYGMSITMLNNKVMELEDEQKAQRDELKQIWGVVHELKGKVA